MSDTGIELATVWVRMVPTVEGLTDNVAKAFAPGGDIAGAEGAKAGGLWSSKVKGAIGAAAITAGVVAAFTGLYKVGETFDEVTDTIRAGTGAQGEALNGLVDVAKNVGTKVPAEFSQIGSTVSDLNSRLGLSGSTLETVASQYLEAGRILGEEVDINKTSAAFSAFKIEGDAVSGAMDTLFRVSQSTGVGMNELAAGVQATAPALQNLGFSFEESVALFGSLDKAGMNSTQIMASMSKGLVTLARDGEQPQEAFKRVTGELQGFIDKGDTASALDLASQIFGTRGASQFVGALQSGVIGMDDLMGAAVGSGDTIMGVGEETMDFAERWKTTMNTAMVAIEPLASAVFSALGDGLEAIMPTLQGLGEWVSENTAVIGAIAAVIGVVLVGAMIAWTASVVANTIAWLANPVTWIILGIIAAIALLVAAIVLIATNWDAIIAWISEAWSGFMGWIGGVIDGFVAWWNGIWSAVGSFISDVWNNIVSGVTSYFTNLWNGLVIIGTAIASWWSGLWNGVVDAFKTIFGAIGDFVSGIFDGVVSGIKTAINWLIDLINGAIDGLNVAGGFLSDITGGAINIKIGHIPKLAEGATVLPRRGGTLAILAEAGKPETVVDTGLLNQALEDGLSGSSSSGQTINIYSQADDTKAAGLDFARRMRFGLGVANV